MKFTKKLITLAVSCCLLASPMAVMATGIPTFDGAAAANAANQIIQMKKQVDNQLSQLSELRSQVKALSGNRNMGQILNTVKDQLPDEWKKIYGGVTATNYKDLMKGKSYTPEQAAKALFANYDSTLKSFQDTKKRLNNIQALMTRINTTQDVKAAADLQSRISAEQAIIQNNQVKLDMMSKMFDLETKMAQMKNAQRESCLADHLVDRKFSACN